MNSQNDPVVNFYKKCESGAYGFGDDLDINRCKPAIKEYKEFDFDSDVDMPQTTKNVKRTNKYYDMQRTTKNINKLLDRKNRYTENLKIKDITQRKKTSITSKINDIDEKLKTWDVPH